MVDPDRLERVLRRIGEDLAKLRRYDDEPPNRLLEDPQRMDAIKYVFVTLLEGCIDAAQHICASESWKAPDDNADAMDVLAAHDVISRDLAHSMRRAVGFRNALVHEYRRIDDDRVLEHLERLEDIDSFIDAVTRLLR